MSLKKKFKFTEIFIVIIITVTLIEFGSFYIISKYKKDFTISPNIVHDLNDAMDKMNHVRHFNVGIKYKAIDELIYSRNITSRNNINPENQVLIQGDSWAYQFLYLKNIDYRKKLYSLESGRDIIYAGISSYSPSLMAAQVEWLNENVKGFSPKIIVAIVDQTDFGDELCRYKDLRYVDKDGSVTVKAFDYIETQNQSTYSVKDKVRYSIILNSKGLNSIKLFKLAYYRTMGKISPIKNCGWSEIAKYLYSGLNFQEENYMIEVFIDYLKSLQKIKNLETVIFVTHPHYLHLKNEYILEMGSFLSNNIKEIENRSKISFKVKLLQIEKFKNFSEKNNIFIVDDDASHITNENHSGYYLNAIEEQIENSR